MSRNDTLALLFASAAACSVFVGAGVWMAESPSKIVAVPAVESVVSPETRIEDLLTYLRGSPRDGDALKRLGALYTETGQLKEAVSAYVSASIERPGDTEIKRALIELQARAQQKGKH
ncbi:hypothetical protein NUH88_14580 [Nisaea acidiphila]|uniref:Tetratricopeptide repeat protein n=1 Tax=Nisaea acidiphila TaxID=1862145 RepID=A0A9J7AME7_9PROT|nr:hypothetical protein [Nisaea acidiphila]UUX48632.1 hypothetical protein NUH88_14580 [Nisaea acidiphila]